MAIVKNTFTKTLSSITSASYTITGLTSTTSTNSVSYVSPEITTQFLTSIYRTLLDAGYSDTSMNSSDYSITVLGFKFFILNTTYNSSNYQSYPQVFVHGSSSKITATSASTTYYINTTDYYNLSYKIIVRGDKNCVGIWYASYSYPNSEVPLIFIAKGAVIGQVLMLFFCLFYGINSLHYHYYGETLTYLGMSLPAVIFNIVSWIRNPYQDTAQVRVGKLTPKRVLYTFLLCFGVTVLFYFL